MGATGAATWWSTGAPSAVALCVVLMVDGSWSSFLVLLGSLADGDDDEEEVDACTEDEENDADTELVLDEVSAGMADVGGVDSANKSRAARRSSTRVAVIFWDFSARCLVGRVIRETL